MSHRWIIAGGGTGGHVTPALALEGMARELVSRLQRMRKEAGYDVTTRIAISIEGDAAVLEAARTHREYIAGETLAREFHAGTGLREADRRESVEIIGSAAVLSTRRLGDGRTLSDPVQADPL